MHFREKAHFGSTVSILQISFDKPVYLCFLCNYGVCTPKTMVFLSCRVEVINSENSWLAIPYPVLPCESILCINYHSIIYLLSALNPFILYQHFHGISLLTLYVQYVSSSSNFYKSIHYYFWVAFTWQALLYTMSKPNEVSARNIYTLVISNFSLAS